jgi:hypothetical protein
MDIWRARSEIAGLGAVPGLKSPTTPAVPCYVFPKATVISIRRDNA